MVVRNTAEVGCSFWFWLCGGSISQSKFESTGEPGCLGGNGWCVSEQLRDLALHVR